MLPGFILLFFSTFCSELNHSKFKKELARISIANINLITGGFIVLFFGFTTLGQLFSGDLSMTKLALILTLIDAFFIVVQDFFFLKAIKSADRGTAAIVRSFTIPLVFIVDYFLGYEISLFSIFGVILIMTTLILFALDKKHSRKGIGYMFIVVFGAVIGVSTYKYAISVEGATPALVQIIVHGASFLFFLSMHTKKRERKSFKSINPLFILRVGITSGVGKFIESYAYLFLNAGIGIALKRTGEMFWALLSGKFIFKEKAIKRKFGYLFILLAGVTLLFL